MRTSFIFYSSFYEALEDLPEDMQLQLYRAIAKYSLFEEELKLKSIANTIFKLIKPQLDANNKRYEDGKKGGRPKTTDSENKKPLVLKKETTGSKNKKPNVNVNVNDNVNDNDNDNDNDNSSSSEEKLKEDEEFSLTKEDEELLIKFAKEKNGIKYPRPWLRKLIKNGDIKDILQKVKNEQRKPRSITRSERILKELKTPVALTKEEEMQIAEIQKHIREDFKRVKT